MAYWWEQDPDERYWVEITDRPDIGADLKCPQDDEGGKKQWSYRLINLIWPGDIVFHYSKPKKEFVGASVAGGPLETRPILWAPHGTVGRKKTQKRTPRPGWWLPLYQYTHSATPLGIAELRKREEARWIWEWTTEKKERLGTVAAPFQLDPNSLRPNQAYLAKMPADFVRRWEPLNDLAERLAGRQDEFAEMARTFPPAGSMSNKVRSAEFKPKSADEYVAQIRGGVQRRCEATRDSCALLVSILQSKGAKVSTPHPIDLLMTSPATVLFEAKVVRGGNAVQAVREAVGQLLEYRYFLGPQTAELCVLLDTAAPNYTLSNA